MCYWIPHVMNVSHIRQITFFAHPNINQVAFFVFRDAFNFLCICPWIKATRDMKGIFHGLSIFKAKLRPSSAEEQYIYKLKNECTKKCNSFYIYFQERTIVRRLENCFFFLKVPNIRLLLFCYNLYFLHPRPIDPHSQNDRPF
jgi:hypothetical protein